MRFLPVGEVDPLFPRTLLGHLKLAAESVFFLSLGIYSIFNWPPAGVAAQGLWVDVFLAILFEMMAAMIPFGLLGLWWAVATPEWIRTFLKRAFHHVGIVLAGFILLGFVGMAAGALGWW